MNNAQYSPIFQTIYDSVVHLTDRPELVRETEEAIMRATLRMHHIDFFWRDKKVVTISATGGSTLAISMGSIPNLRKFNNVVVWSRGTPVPLTLTGAAQLFKSPTAGNKDYIPNAAIMSGDTLNIRCRYPITSVAIEYYSNPILDFATYDSWVAQLYKFAIIDDAAATILYSIGANEQGASLRALVGTKAAPGRDTHIHTILQEQLDEVDPGSD